MWLSASNQDKDNVSKFCKAFGKNLKLSIHKEAQNRNKLAEFLRFLTKSVGEWVSFKGELSSSCDVHPDMPEIQESVHYLTGESLMAVRHYHSLKFPLSNPSISMQSLNSKSFGGKTLVFGSSVSRRKRR